MKQFLLLTLMMLLGACGALVHAFWGVLLYYSFAVLRPQHLWDWALPFQVRWSLLAAMVAVGGVVLNLHRIELRRVFCPIGCLVVLFGLLLLLSMLNSHFPGIAQSWGIEYAKILFMVLLAVLTIDRFWQIHAMTVMILIAIGYIAWEINSLYLFDGRLDVFHRGYGGLDNNGAGLMIVMGMPLAYAYATAASRRWQQALAVLLGLFMLHAMLMTYSRGAMLAALVGGVWLLIHHRPRWQSPWIAVALMVVVSFFAGQEIRDRFNSTRQYQSDGSAQSRMQSWSAAWRLTWDAPLTGQGIRNGNRFSQGFGADRQGRTIHSQYLQIAADSGVPAMATYIGILALAFGCLRRSRRMCQRCGQDEPPPQGRLTPRQVGAIALGCETSLVTFAFGAVFLSLEVFELPWLLIALAAAMPEAVRRHLNIDAVERLDAPAPRPYTAPETSIKTLQGLMQS